MIISLISGHNILTFSLPNIFFNILGCHGHRNNTNLYPEYDQYWRENVTVRLSGGKYFEGGYVEIWKDGSWGLMCDKGRNTWTKNSADVVCRHLGFSGSLQNFHGDTQLWSIPNTGT